MVQTALPYHQLMTPKWIEHHATITAPHALYPQYFEILPTTGVGRQRALQVQLVAPNILTSTDHRRRSRTGWSGHGLTTFLQAKMKTINTVSV